MAIAQAQVAESSISFNASWKDGAWGLALLLLAGGQLAIGTDPLFTFLVVSFSLLTIAASRMCGGLNTLTGITIAYTGFQHILFSQFAKLVLGQRPDLPLFEPIQTMIIYNLGMLGVLCAATLTLWKPLRVFRPVLTADISPDRLKVMAYVLSVLMILRYLGSPQVGLGGVRFLMNFEFLTNMSAAATAAWVVTSTGGKKFMNWLSWINVTVPFLVAVIGFQRREAIFTVLIMVAVALAYGFRFRATHILTAVAGILFFQFIFFPFALYYRNNVKKTGDLTRNLTQAWDALSEVIADPLKYQEQENFQPPEAEWEVRRLLYYDRKSIPTMDRFSIIIISDAIIQAADGIPPTQWAFIKEGFDMLTPRVFNDDKAILGTSNQIAQIAPGAVNDLDLGTQITLGIFCESYLAFRYWGAFLIPFVVFSLSMLTVRMLIGDEVKENLWTCSYILVLPWVCSEGTVQQFIILYWQTLTLFAAFGFALLIFANSLARGVNRQQERVPEDDDTPKFESKTLRMIG
jgi:hypothetical protein